MSEEPIDLSAWLNEAPMSETEQGAAAAVASVTDADVAAAEQTLQNSEAGGAEDLLDTFPAALTAPVENGTADYTPEPLPDFENLAQPAPEVSTLRSADDPAVKAVTRAEKLADLDARDEALDKFLQPGEPEPGVNALGDDPADEPHDTRVFHSMLRNDIRAVGDRVTMVYETINRLETDVAAFAKMFRALLKALEVEESELPEIPPAEPKRRRPAKKAE